MKSKLKLFESKDPDFTKFLTSLPSTRPVVAPQIFESHMAKSVQSSEVTFDLRPHSGPALNEDLQDGSVLAQINNKPLLNLKSCVKRPSKFE